MNRLFIAAAIFLALLTATIPLASTVAPATAQEGPEEPEQEVTITTADGSGAELTGMWMSVRLESGEYFGSGYSPLSFPATPGETYVITAADYDGIAFLQWEDGSTESTRTITIPTDTDSTLLTAQYDTGMSMSAVTPVTHPDGEPSLTVEAMQGDETLNIWTIIVPHPTNDDSQATYTVYAGNYQNHVFDSWSDGNTDRIRTITISEDTTITAQYKQAENMITIPFGAFDPSNPPYDPVELSVEKGETVVVNNVDVAPHSVTSGTGPADPTAATAFETGLMFQNDYAHIETDNLAAGEYDYYCFVHPFMTGKLTVTE